MYRRVLAVLGGPVAYGQKTVLLQKLSEDESVPSTAAYATSPEHLCQDPILSQDISLRDALDLALLDHMHGLIALDSPPCGTEGAKPQARIDAAFYKAMLLLDHII